MPWESTLAKTGISYWYAFSHSGLLVISLTYQKNPTTKIFQVSIFIQVEFESVRWGFTCKTTSWRESWPDSEKAEWSFSLRPSHKQQPGLSREPAFLLWMLKKKMTKEWKPIWVYARECKPWIKILLPLLQWLPFVPVLLDSILQSSPASGDTRIL